MNRRAGGIWLLLVFVSIRVVVAQSNEGTDFWMSFLEHRNSGNNNMVVMISSKTNTSGTISIPLRGFSTGFTVGANDVTLINMPAYAETIGSEVISNNAIHVTSVDPVSIYIHQYQSFRAEASLVLPTPVLGREYYVMAYEGFAQEDDGASEFVVVATQDQTAVRIELSDQTKGGLGRGDIIDIVLNQGETYQVRGLRTVHDLTGTYLSGDKNFALFAGSSYSRVPISCGNRDNLLEQMYPISTWGNTYVTATTRDGDYNVFRILAAENNTSVLITDLDNTQEEVNLNRGEFYEYQRFGPTMITNKDPDDRRGFLVAQYIVGAECVGQQWGGPSMVILNGVEQIRDTVTVYNSSFQNIFENYISIICQTRDVDGIQRNGNPVNSGWTQIGLNGELSFTIQEVNQGRHTITSSGCGVIALAFGLGQAEGYAYFGGANFNRINANPIPDGECVGNPVQFASGLPQPRYEVEWVTEFGDTITDHEFLFEFPSEDEGEYQVKLHTFDNCFLTRDTSEKMLRMTYQQKTISLDDDIEICQNEKLELSTENIPNATYAWAGPDNFESQDQFPFVDPVNFENAGVYTVSGIVFGCIAEPVNIEVDVNPIPQPNLGQDSVLCDRNVMPHVLSVGNFYEYLWSDGSNLPELSIEDAGAYSVTVTTEFDCENSDTINFESRCPTAIYIPNVFSPNDDFVNDEFNIQAFDVIESTLYIYDRWGNLLFETSDLATNWDGTFRNKLLGPDVFSWILSYTGYDNEGDVISEVKKGTVTLIR